MRRGFRCTVLAAAIALAAGTRASRAESAGEEPEATATKRDDTYWRSGLELRTDFGAHPLRISAGVRGRQTTVSAVFDPMFLIDGQHDFDALLERRIGSSPWSWELGWRVTTIEIDRGLHWQQKSVFGVVSPLPPLGSDRVRGKLGAEMTVLWVKHGGGLATEWFSFSRQAIDLVNVGLFLRFEYEAPL